jgi:flagellar biosynthesis/type III secretory pathway M-ring protein FliF/YscJ
MSSLNQIKEFWKGLSNTRKVILVGSVLASLVVFLVLVSWVREPEYAVLFFKP